MPEGGARQKMTMDEELKKLQDWLESASLYELPSYKELDPTIFVAVTYSFLFGAMFGDLGQGLLLLIGGFILYKKKHMALAGIISTAGFFSSIFGIMFGSILLLFGDKPL